jgi:hypothetical protein
MVTFHAALGWQCFAFANSRLSEHVYTETRGGSPITSTGVGVLLEAMEQSSHIHGSLQLDWIDNGMRTWFLRVGKNALPNLHTSLLLVARLTMMAMALGVGSGQNTSVQRFT